MTQACPALLSLFAAVTLLGADKPTASGHAPVRDEAWMNERPIENKMLTSGQQLDTVGQLVDVPGRLLAVEFAQGGKILLVKTTTVLASLDAATMKLIQKADYPIVKGGGSMRPRGRQGRNERTGLRWSHPPLSRDGEPRRQNRLG